MSSGAFPYVLTPAYGRDYKSKKDLLADLNAGKDFEANGPTGSVYCSLSDIPDGASVQVRWKRLTQVGIVKVRTVDGAKAAK